MKKPLLKAWEGITKPVIGMVHLAALPGSPRYAGDWKQVQRAAVQDARELVRAGVHGLMLENYGDVPFFPGRVPVHVVTHMTAIACEIRSAFPEMPLGLNVLRNDGQSALAISAAVGGCFIRVNVLTAGRLTDQGIIQGIAHELMRDRSALASDVKVLADVDVKHSSPLGPVSTHQLEDEVANTVERGLADAIVVSGRGTGKAVDLAKLQRIHAAAGSTPVWIGSGASADTLRQLWPLCEGLIVGSALQCSSMAGQGIDPLRAKEFMTAWQSLS